MYVPEDDEHWSCLLMLWDICTSITAFDIERLDASNLAWTVEVFLETLRYLCTELVFTPKLHYLLHLPEDMLRYAFLLLCNELTILNYCTHRFGPLRNTWCMRFELKNKELKSFTSSCYKNVSYSVSVRHQQAACHVPSVCPGQQTSQFIYAGDKIFQMNYIARPCKCK